MEITKYLLKLFAKVSPIDYHNATTPVSSKVSQPEKTDKLNPNQTDNSNSTLVIYCPNCYSTDIQLLAPEQQTTEHHFKYLCLLCRTRFDDDTKTPFDFILPTIEVWLQCWFLLNSHHSLEYIANKLHVDIAIVKLMVQELNAMFTSQTITADTDYSKWKQKYGQYYAEKITLTIFKKKTQELHTGMAINQPIDTAEIRRQTKNKKPTLPKNIVS